VPEKTEDSGYGRIGWVTGPEGNKVELWQPSASLRPAHAQRPPSNPRPTAGATASRAGQLHVRCDNLVHGAFPGHQLARLTLAITASGTLIPVFVFGRTA
jgi:hypothetical protein